MIVYDCLWIFLTPEVFGPDPAPVPDPVTSTQPRCTCISNSSHYFYFSNGITFTSYIQA